MKTTIIFITMLSAVCARHLKRDLDTDMNPNTSKQLEPDFEPNLEKDIDAYVLNFENELSYLDHYNYRNPNHNLRPGRLVQNISIRYYMPIESEFFETSNGIQVNQQGEIKNPGTENEHLETKGEYSYVAPNGVLYQVSYTAGENGFRPVVKARRIRPFNE